MLVSSVEALLDAPVGIGVVLAAVAQDQVKHGASQPAVSPRIALGELLDSVRAVACQLSGELIEALRLRVVEPAHVCLGAGDDSAQNRLFSTSGAGAVARHQGLVVVDLHQMVVQHRRLGVDRRLRVIQPEVLVAGLR